MSPPATTTDFPLLLSRLRVGDEQARQRFFALVYQDLRRRARGHLRGYPAATLSPTTLVHEALIRLLGTAQVSWEDRAHFFSVASLAMRQILVDNARRRLAKKRNLGIRPRELDEAAVRLEERATELVALDEALARLRSVDERLARIDDLRFFGGLSFEEAGEVLELSPRTVKREWSRARVFLYEALEKGKTA
jgi:RNA polymerase sigma factor (TIGR02999 family)